MAMKSREIYLAGTRVYVACIVALFDRRGGVEVPASAQSG